MPRFIVEGVCIEDGSRTTLKEAHHSSDAVHFYTRYIRTEDAGGWDFIEVYDLCSEPPARMAFWEREST